MLEELEIVVNDLESQFQSGVNLVLMLGLLEGYYIPHYLWHYTPKNFEEKVRPCCVGQVTNWENTAMCAYCSTVM